MKVIQLVGGSGFIGTNLINQLSDSYTVLNADKTQSKKFSAKTTIADVRNKEQLCKAIQPCDWIILLAAEHKDDVLPASLYYEVNVNGTANVIDVIKEKNIKKIIFTSTVAVYGLHTTNADETAAVNPFNDYGKSKAKAEELLRTWYHEDAVNRTLIILRPTVVFGPHNRGNVYNLLKQIASGKFLMIGSGNNKKSMAHVNNVVGFIKFCMNENFSGYHLFNYADKPDFTMNELVKTSERALHKKLPSFKIPYFIGYTAGLFFDALAYLFKRKFSISSVRVKKFCATTQFSSGKMLTTGYKPLHTLEEGLIKTLESIEQD